MTTTSDRLAALPRALRTAAAGLLSLAALAGSVRAANPEAMEIWVQMPVSVSLVAEFGTSPATVSVGQPFLLTMTVSNTGAAPASGVTAALWKASGAGAAAPGTSNPASVAVMNPGESTVFTWTVTASVAGPICWTGTATATAGGAAATAPVTPMCTVIQTPPNLTAVASVNPANVCVGQPFDVTVTMANLGQATTTGVTVLPWAVSGTGAAFYAAGPLSLNVTLAGGTSTAYVWTYGASAAGGIGFAMTVTGLDANAGNGVVGPRIVTPAVAVNSTASLYVAASVQPTVSQGQQFTVDLTVTNTGGVNATGVTASLYIVSGPGQFVSASIVPVTLATSGGGASHTFSWTVLATGVGAINVTATVSGLACGASSVGAAASVATTVIAAPTLAGTISVSPTTYVQGQVIMVSVTLNNTGGGQLVNLIPTLNATGPVSAPGVPIMPNGSPMSATGIMLSGPGAITLRFSFTPTGAGMVSFFGGASGTDPNSGGTLTATDTPASFLIGIESPAGMALTLALNPSIQAQVFWTVTATLSVRNTGQSDLQINSINRSFVDPMGLLGPAGVISPAPSGYVIPGLASANFVWTYSAAKCGSVPFQLSVDVQAQDVTLTRTLAAGPTSAGSLTVASAPASMVVTVLDSKVKVAGLSNLTVTVYDSCLPAVGVAGETINLAVITGGGKIIYLSGPTDAKGTMRGIVLTGDAPGQNAYLVADPNLPGTTVFVEGTVPDVPTPFLSKNFINPARGEKLQVRVSEPVAVHLSVRVFNLAGELVRVVKSADVLPGLTIWDWDGRNDHGEKVGNGTYFIQVLSGRKSQIMRVIILSQ